MVMCLRLMGRIVSALTLVGVSLAPAIDVEAQSTRPSGEWHATGGDHTNTKYSPLDEITPENFLELEVAWNWTSIETEVTAQKEDLRPLEFKTTPLMIDGLVYASTSIGQVGGWWVHLVFSLLALGMNAFAFFVELRAVRRNRGAIEEINSTV